MSKTLDKVRAMPYVMAVDDERGYGGSIIVTLHEPYCFVDDPTCGTKGCDTVKEALDYCHPSNIYKELS
jgi:hypothetical protein